MHRYILFQDDLIAIVKKCSHSELGRITFHIPTHYEGIVSWQVGGDDWWITSLGTIGTSANVVGNVLLQTYMNNLRKEVESCHVRISKCMNEMFTPDFKLRIVDFNQGGKQ